MTRLTRWTFGEFDLLFRSRRRIPVVSLVLCLSIKYRHVVFVPK